VYAEAGENVMNLFLQQGLPTVIADRLVFRVLLFCNLGVAATCGLVAVLCDMVVEDSQLEATAANTRRRAWYPFLLPFSWAYSSRMLLALLWRVPFER
jgi:hypothetical protein